MQPMPALTHRPRVQDVELQDVAAWLGVDAACLDGLAPDLLAAISRGHDEWRSAVHVADVLSGTAAADRRRIRALEQGIRRDPLTGILNRRGIEEHRDRAMRRAVASGHHLSIMMVDVDGLKRVNDRLGHAAGDALIKAAAGAIRLALRPGDLVGRVGGDEFLCVVPGAAEPDAAAIGRRITQSTEGPEFARFGNRPHLSVGWASTSEGLRDPAELTAAADRRMYDERRHRRSQAVAALEVSVPITIRQAIRLGARAAEVERRTREALARSAELLRRQAPPEQEPGPADRQAEGQQTSGPR